MKIFSALMVLGIAKASAEALRMPADTMTGSLVFPLQGVTGVTNDAIVFPRYRPMGHVDHFGGRCPFCMGEHKKSTVQVGGCTTTLLAPRAYYDEQGHYHYEDPNRTTCLYRCSKGHEFSVTNR